MAGSRRARADGVCRDDHREFAADDGDHPAAGHRDDDDLGVLSVAAVFYGRPEIAECLTEAGAPVTFWAAQDGGASIGGTRTNSVFGESGTFGGFLVE